MTDPNLMEGAPPPAAQQVTLENWRTAPFNRWSYRNVRNLVPSAAIRRDPARCWRLQEDPGDLAGLRFRGADGAERRLERWLDESLSDGLLVLQGERIVFERYLNGLAADVPHILMSVSKSVTGALAGILAGRGQLDPSAPVAAYVPEVAGSAYQSASVRHLLDMRVGVHFDEDYLARDGAIVRYREATNWKPPIDPANPGDLRSFLVGLPAEGAHGGPFHYVSPNSDLLGWVLERATDKPLAELLSAEIWQPLGAEHEAYVTVDRLGAPRAAGGICTSLRDLGRFGLMMARGGAADGRPVVPAPWITDIRDGGDKAAWQAGGFPQVLPDGAYRSQWYATGHDSGAICGLGVYGQYLYVVPETEVVIAKFSSAVLPVEDAVDLTNLAAFEAITDAIADRGGDPA